MADTFSVEREIRVDAPAEALYSRLVDFHRWSAWSPFEQLDPDMERTYRGAASGSGAVYEWAGNMKAGTGRMEMVDAEPDRRIVIDQQNLKPLKSRVTVTFALDESADGTSITWSMTGEKTLMTRAMGIFKSMDGMIGPVFEQGLAKLKAEAEGTKAEEN
jgi:uncharacterized protein YndB with AHSA1/START domain